MEGISSSSSGVTGHSTPQFSPEAVNQAFSDALEKASKAQTPTPVPASDAAHKQQLNSKKSRKYEKSLLDDESTDEAVERKETTLLKKLDHKMQELESRINQNRLGL